MLILTVALSLGSCKTISKEVEVPIRTEIKVIEKEIPVPIPPDSASIYALFECDSLNRVIMTQLDENKSQNMTSSGSFTDGILRYKFRTIRDTVYVHKTDSFIYAEKPIKIKVTEEVNKLKWWQKFLLWSGAIGWMVFIGGMAFNITKKY